MNSIKIPFAAQSTARFAMPISGRTVAVQACVTGDHSLANAQLPGTSVWRPPIC